MPSYWPDKPHKPAYRRPLNKIGYWLYLRFGRRSRYWGRVWSEREVFRILRVLSRRVGHITWRVYRFLNVDPKQLGVRPFSRFSRRGLAEQPTRFAFGLGGPRVGSFITTRRCAPSPCPLRYAMILWPCGAGIGSEGLPRLFAVTLGALVVGCFGMVCLGAPYKAPEGTESGLAIKDGWAI